MAYVEKIDGVCYLFEDVAPEELTDQSFTLSYSFDEEAWVFFHDYIPDFYFSTRNQLYTIKDNTVYIHNSGAYGQYYGGVNSFFVDAVFRNQEEMILNGVKWLTEVFNNVKEEQEFSTLTHITVTNNQQCTGRIAISDVFKNLEYERRKTQALWSFNDLRDMIKVTGTKFLLDIFNNFAVDTTNIDVNKPWFDKDLLHDSWFTVRFEFDNASGNQIILHEVDINASKSYR